MTLLALSILCGLATWRLASLLHTEDAFEWLRRWIGILNDTDGYPADWPDTFWGNLFHCFWCLSLAVGLPVVVWVMFAAGMSWRWAPLVWLSASAVSIWLEKQIMRTQSR